MSGATWRHVAIGRDAHAAPVAIDRDAHVGIRTFQVARAACDLKKDITKRSELARARGAWPMGEQPGSRAARVRGLLAQPYAHAWRWVAMRGDAWRWEAMRGDLTRCARGRDSG